MGKKPDMDDGVRRRFATLIEASGVEHKAASLKAGLGATYVGDVIRKGRGKLDLVIKIVEQLAPSYAEWVRTGRGAAPPATLAADAMDEELPFDGPVKVIGIIGSGGVAQLGSSAAEETLQVYAPPGTVALKNDGISLGVPFQGWFVLYRDRRRPYRDELLDKLCVVRTSQGTTLVRWIRHAGSTGLQLVSALGEIEPDVEVVWAEEVITLQPR